MRFLLVTARIIIGRSRYSYLAITGFSISRGNLFLMRLNFSRTSRAAKSISVPGSNSKMTITFPSLDMERIFLRWVTVPTASSTGLAMRISISEAGIPPRTLILMVISPKLVLGIISTGKSLKVIVPIKAMPIKNIEIAIGLFTDRLGRFIVFLPYSIHTTVRDQAARGP